MHSEHSVLLSRDIEKLQQQFQGRDEPAEAPPSNADLVLYYYDRESGALAKYLSFLGVEPDGVRDLVHDAFLKLHQHVRSGGDCSQIRAWLYRVVHNLAQSRRVSSWSKRVSSSEAMTPEATNPTWSSASPEQALLEREREARLKGALAALPATQRECMALRGQGLTYREIGSVLKLSTSTVAEHVQRAIEHLRSTL